MLCKSHQVPQTSSCRPSLHSSHIHHIISHQSLCASLHLIGKRQHRLVLTLPNLAIDPNQPELHDPSPTSTKNRETRTAAHSDGVSRLVGIWPQVGCPDEGGIGDSVDDCERGCFLLFRLTARGRDPAEDYGVYSVSADGEHD